jgi:hypothetical protein
MQHGTVFILFQTVPNAHYNPSSILGQQGRPEHSNAIRRPDQELDRYQPDRRLANI